MRILDDIKKMQKLDKSNLLSSIQQLSLQLVQTQNELKNLSIPADYSQVDKIVVNGMGGSRLGARVAERLFEDKLKIPVIPIGSYTLPACVDSKTLYIISSYSGNTEEPLGTIEEAIKRNAKILVFAQNGKLAKLAKDQKMLGYFGFEPKYNPCNQPRMSLGYQVIGIMILLAKCGLLKISDNKLKELIKFINTIKPRYDINITIGKNEAKKLALEIKGKIPILIGAEFLMGALHVWKNQTCENGKHLGVYFEIPELNHYLMEGLGFPKTNPDNLLVIFTKSDLYHPRNQKRIEVTKKVLDGYKIRHREIKLMGDSKLKQAFELIQFGSFVVFYLSMLNKVDPSPIPWVDFFKLKLSSH